MSKIVTANLNIWKMKEQRLKLNKQGEPCSICQMNRGRIKITDEKTKKDYFVCKDCDKKIKWEQK